MAELRRMVERYSAIGHQGRTGHLPTIKRQVLETPMA
jgi:hypothetical protein